MIRRLELGQEWVEFRMENGMLEMRSNHIWGSGLWRSIHLSYTNDIDVAVKDYIRVGFKDVTHLRTGNMSVDPNDLLATAGNPCCGGSALANATWKNGKWHDKDCSTLKPDLTQLQKEADAIFASLTPPSSRGGCTCGSASVGSDRHSNWCDVK